MVGDNGVLNRATDASKKTNRASEKEAIEFIMSDIKTSLMIEEEIPSEKYIGDKLSEMSAITGDWKNVTVGENTYKDGWYLVEKGSEITGYGKAKLNWLINYETGEIIELKDGEYTISNANASGAIVDETLKLNIDPVNLQDSSKWGNEVKFFSGKESNESGVKKTEIKFDGVDDYLKIEGVNLSKNGGITFEYYGKNYGTVRYPLEKIQFDENGIPTGYTNFRWHIEDDNIGCVFGSIDCQSDLRYEESYNWFGFDGDFGGDYNYITITLNFKTSEMILYKDGGEIARTTLGIEYLESGDIFKNEIPFVVGLICGGAPWTIQYGKFDIYACRLYTRVLSDTEIGLNFTATTNYHNELVK